MEYPEFAKYIGELLTPGWIITVNELKARMQRGKEVAEQINILGDDGVPIAYHVIFWKSELIDFAFLQQDAFDKVDAVSPIKRQKYMVDLMMDICHAEFEFATFTEVMDYFKKMINICKQMNYSLFQSEEFKGFEKELKAMIQVASSHS